METEQASQSYLLTIKVMHVDATLIVQRFG